MHDVKEHYEYECRAKRLDASRGATIEIFPRWPLFAVVDGVCGASLRKKRFFMKILKLS